MAKARSNPASTASIATYNAPTPGEVAQMTVQDTLTLISQRGFDLINELRRIHSPPTGTKSLRSYRSMEAAEMIGRSVAWLRAAESQEGFPAPPREGETGWRHYSLDDINAIREFAGTRPVRGPTDATQIIAMLNFKGGCSKTSACVLLSHYLATSGYRVLLVDLDPQGSLTSSYELSTQDGQPVTTVNWEQSVGSVMVGDSTDLSEQILRTHWSTIDMIPCAIETNEAELTIAVETARQGPGQNPFWSRLEKALRKVEGYDIILIDSAPALNFGLINAVYACDGVIIPTPARNLDLEAVVKFARVVEAWISKLPGFELRKRWLRLFLTQFTRNSVSDQTHSILARNKLGALILTGVFPSSEAIRRGSAGAPSCYEATPPNSRGLQTSNARVREALDEAFAEIMTLISSNWTQRSTAP